MKHRTGNWKWRLRWRECGARQWYEKKDDILDICKVLFTELQTLGFPDLRNAIINFWDDAHTTLLDYDYSDFALHFLPFQQGMLYVGTVAAFQEDELRLVQSLADAFSTAYA
ncbi:MAG: hypothetical protein M3342_04305, partial [Bacteroidota bacterium]|nr:hypothetical protein [Bacteroidota bacterium]